MLRNKNFLIWNLLLVFLAVAALLQSQLMMSWDNSWLLLMTKRWLAGGTYTKDFFDSDPPMILYIYSLPLLLAKLTGLNLIIVFRVFTFFLSFFSLFISYLLLKSIFKKDIYLRTVWILSLALIFWIVPAYEFGQRDFLIMMLLTPYLLSMIARLNNFKAVSPLMALVIGLMAGIGIGIKPYFLLIILLSEIYFIIYSKRLQNCLRVDTLTLALTLAAYVLSIYLIFPDYISTVVPFAIRLYPGGMGEPLLKMTFSYYSLFCFAVVLFGWFMPVIDGYKKIINYMSVILLGFVALYIYQRTFFYYHFLPAFYYSILLAIFNLTLLLTKSSQQLHFLPIKIACSILFLIYMMVFGSQIWLVIVFHAWAFYLFFAAIYFYTLVCLRSESLVRNFVLALVISGITVLFSNFCFVMDWYTHPFLLNLVVMIGLFAFLAPANTVEGRFENGLNAFLVAVVLAYPVYFVVASIEAEQKYDAYVSQGMLNEFLNYKKYGPIAVYSTTTRQTFPAIEYADAEYGIRFPFFWMIPTFSELQRVDAQARQDIDFTINAVAEDLNSRKPAYVFIDSNKNKAYLKVPFDYLIFLNQSKNFQTAWANYQYVGEFSIPDEIFSNKYAAKFSIYKRVR
jgi:hypothetical protein